MELATMRAFFGWCSVINAGVLVITFFVWILAADWVYRMHSRWFRIPRESFDLILYGFLGAAKLLVLIFNFVPYLTLAIIG